MIRLTLIAEIEGEDDLFSPEKISCRISFQDVIVNSVKELRADLRERVKDTPPLMELFGFRIARKPRALIRRNLRRPTLAERKTAKAMRRDGMADHVVERHFNDLGIQMTRNRQSRDDGARQ